MTHYEAIENAKRCRNRGYYFYDTAYDRFEKCYKGYWKYAPFITALKLRINKEFCPDKKNGDLECLCPYSSPNIYLTEEQLHRALKILDEMFPE